jgi:hypothetical protein
MMNAAASTHSNNLEKEKKNREKENNEKVR